MEKESVATALYLRPPKRKVNFLLKTFMLLRVLLHLCIVLTFVCGMSNIAQIFGHIISLKAPKFGKQLISFVSGAALVSFVISLEYVAGLKLEVSGDKLPVGENAICVGNHLSDIDFVLFMCMAYRKGMLGNVKYMAKDSLKQIPFLGWGMYMMDMIFLKRNWEKDKESITNTFKHITSTKIPVWAIIFPEGTRITKKKHESSLAFAKERNIKPYTQTLIPRTKGFSAMSKHFKNSHVEYVYDFTFAYTDGILTIQDLLSWGAYGSKVCINVKRYALKDLPDSDEGLRDWCFKSFERKDRLLSEIAEKKENSFVNEPIIDEPIVGNEWWVKPFEGTFEDVMPSKKRD